MLSSLLAATLVAAGPIPPLGSGAMLGDIVGFVTDTAGVALPNASVTLAGTSRATTTDARGRFSFRQLAPGTYHLDARLIGFAPSHASVTVGAEPREYEVRITLRPTALRLSSVQVTASPVGTDPHEITQSTIDLSDQELVRRLGANIAQTLSSEPGMAVRFSGAATLPVIRGLTGDRILMLQDGMRAGDLSFSSADHALSVDPLAATRVEVVRGPASLLYGSNALGGVVNVISNDIPLSVPSHLEGSLSTQGESVNPGGAAAAAVTAPVGASGAVSVRGSARRISDLRVGGGGRLGNSFSRSTQLVGGAGFTGNRVTSGVAVRDYRFTYGLPAPSGDPETGSRIDGARRQVTARVDVDLAVPVLTHVRADASGQWYAHDEIEAGGDVATSFALRTQTVNALGNLRYGRIDGALGVSGLFRQYEARGEEALTPGATTQSSGLFLYHRMPVHRVTSDADPADRHVAHVEVGARFDYYRITSETGEAKFGPATTREFRNWSGSVGANAPLGRGVSLGLNAAAAFRAPTVEELFSNAFHTALGSYDIGNPALRLERNRGIEAVLRADRMRLVGQATAFYNRIADYIAPSVIGDTTTDVGAVVPINRYTQADAVLRGAEAQFEAHVADGWVVGGMADIVRGRFLAGGPVPFMPAARVGASARWDNRRFNVGMEARHAFAQDRAADRRAAGELPADAYTVVNLSAGATVMRGILVHALVLRVDNVGDVAYREATSRIKSYALNPGRNVSLTYRLLY